jgi:hypothetical protein
LGRTKDKSVEENGLPHLRIEMCGTREFLAGSECGKVNIEMVANEENQDSAQGRKNETGWVIPFVSRAKNQVGYGAAEDRSDDAEHDGPHEGQMHVHHGFPDNPSE